MKLVSNLTLVSIFTNFQLLLVLLSPSVQILAKYGAILYISYSANFLMLEMKICLKKLIEFVYHDYKDSC